MTNDNKPKAGDLAPTPPEMKHPVFKHATNLIFIHAKAAALNKAADSDNVTNEEGAKIAHALDDALNAVPPNADMPFLAALIELLKYITPGQDIFTDVISVGVMTHKHQTPRSKMALLRLQLCEGRNLAIPMDRQAAEEFERNIKKAFDDIFGRIPIIH